MAERSATAEVTLLGAGLVGALEALCLARRGHTVQVYERLPDLRTERVAGGRSINLAISERGLHALRRVGLEREARAHALPMRGRLLHAADSSLAFQAYGKDDSQCIHSISRAWLNQLLLDAAEATGQVRIAFRERVREVDFEARRLSLVGPADISREVAYRVLIGADGSGSAMRQALQRHLGSAFECSQEMLGHGYKEIVMPAARDGAFPIDPQALHIWPRGNFMLIALPNQGGSFTCTLFLPFEGAPSFQSLRGPAEVEAFFESQFPDARALVPDLAEQFFAHPTGQMGTLKASPWSLGPALLMGDAAHALVPFYGQGMNCGFEDCMALDDLLAAKPAPTLTAGFEATFEASFRAFERQRKPNADAIADMAVENFVEMRDKTADPHFLLEKQIEKVLLNAFPGRFLSRYSLVSFSLAPYRVAYDVGRIAQGIVSELARGLRCAEELDRDRAARLISERLDPYLASLPGWLPKESIDGSPPRQ